MQSLPRRETQAALFARVAAIGFAIEELRVRETAFPDVEVDVAVSRRPDDDVFGARRAGLFGASASLAGSKNSGQTNQRNPPQVTGPSAKPRNRGSGPLGSGWLAARVPVAGSKITIGPHSDTPHNFPASRSQSAVASSK